MSEAPVEPRVGDRERHAADEHLRAAVGDGVLTLSEYEERAGQLWSARTRREVAALLADLPGLQPVVVDAPPARTTGRTRRAVAVMSETEVTGPLAPGQVAEGWAVMGKAVVDLRRADLADGTRVRAGALMGEVEVQVPPGTVVHLSGLTLMGERKVRVAPGDGPVVHVDAYALMGSVNVTVGDGSVAPAQSTRAVAWAPPVTSRRLPDHSPPPTLVRRIARRASGAAIPLGLGLGLVAVIASGTDARTVFGSTTERVGADDDGAVQVSVLFGSVIVVVPDDVRVDTGGLVVFGSVDCVAACDGTGEGRRIDVSSYGGFGSVEVVTETELATDG